MVLAAITILTFPGSAYFIVNLSLSAAPVGSEYYKFTLFYLSNVF
jgi:hypothetical protein